MPVTVVHIATPDPRSSFGVTRFNDVSAQAGIEERQSMKKPTPVKNM